MDSRLATGYFSKIRFLDDAVTSQQVSEMIVMQKSKDADK